MKINKNYCKFVSQVKSSQVKSSQVKSSQVKSSQVKSSAKIVFLIALLFILLFSISCKPKQDPNEGGSHSKSELVGTWKNDNYNIYTLTINNNGDIKYKRNGSSHTYTGKIADNFYYPYTTEIVTTISGQTRIGTITFDNASSCTGSSYWYRFWGRWFSHTFIFTNSKYIK